jgi:hypothetical protein
MHVDMQVSAFGHEVETISRPNYAAGYHKRRIDYKLYSY